MRPSRRQLDPRPRRTREALQSAFTLLALKMPFDDIRVDDILEASGVGRSTFYEHFSSKDALLAVTMDGAIAVLADVPTGNASPKRLEMLLAHFWENRALARRLFRGSGLRVIRNHLVLQVENRLARHAGDRLRLPRRLVARALADGMLSPIVSWLDGEAPCSPANLADALKRSSEASRAALVAAASRA